MKNEKDSTRLSGDLIRRTELIDASQSCDWCGQKRHRGGHELSTLFRYGVLTPMCREHLDHNLFCSQGCRDSFYS
jgi:hypothetical protein